MNPSSVWSASSDRIHNIGEMRTHNRPQRVRTMVNQGYYRHGITEASWKQKSSIVAKDGGLSGDHVLPSFYFPRCQLHDDPTSSDTSPRDATNKKNMREWRYQSRRFRCSVSFGEALANIPGFGYLMFNYSIGYDDSALSRKCHLLYMRKFILTSMSNPRQYGNMWRPW